MKLNDTPTLFSCNLYGKGRHFPGRDADAKENEDDWDDVDPEEVMVDEDEMDPSFCFMCDLEHDSIESYMVRMHKKHGFFIPDIYLKDLRGLLTYLSIKVRGDFMCLYCNERCHLFSSLKAMSYTDVAGKQLVALNEANSVELGSGSKLVISRKTERCISFNTLGSRGVLTRTGESIVDSKVITIPFDCTIQ
ncbi:hypothetical protein Ancab_023132 [Ancistrocladus abbreviatus]